MNNSNNKKKIITLNNIFIFQIILAFVLDCFEGELKSNILLRLFLAGLMMLNFLIAVFRSKQEVESFHLKNINIPKWVTVLECIGVLFLILGLIFVSCYFLINNNGYRFFHYYNLISTQLVLISIMIIMVSQIIEDFFAKNKLITFGNCILTIALLFMLGLSLSDLNIISNDFLGNLIPEKIIDLCVKLLWSIGIQ